MPPNSPTCCGRRGCRWNSTATSSAAPPASRGGRFRASMAPVKINPDNIREFKDAELFYKWLAKHHDKQGEIWIRIHKVDSGLKSITPKQAIDVVLCWGWIDGQRKGLDDKSFLQRYSPRTKKSIWSQINVDNVDRLVKE